MDRKALTDEFIDEKLEDVNHFQHYYIIAIGVFMAHIQRRLTCLSSFELIRM